MSSISITKKDITKMNTDCIVNAANEGLAAGGGVCGAIFRAAGHRKLQRACDEIGRCPTGSACITPGFDLKARHIIHAVGPVWQGGGRGEPEALYNCYRRALEIAMENGCHSIAFPLISSGIFGYPKSEAWEKAIQSCIDFLELHEEYEIEIYFAVIDDITMAMGEKVLNEMLGDEEDEEEELKSTIIDASFEEDGPYHLGCPSLEEALSDWHESDSEEELAEILEQIVRLTKEGGLQVIVPVAYDEEDGEMMFQLVTGDEEDESWMTCFTNQAEKTKGEGSSSTVLAMKEVMEKSLEIDGCSGIAMNPWGEGIFIPREIIESMLKDMEPKTQDIIDYEEGLMAYAACDHDRAAELLQRAAEAGNVNAMGRLGYCFYYGYGAEKDPVRARNCWTKAAIFGDICATFKLGDLYRSGEIDDDPGFAGRLYQKAFVDACQDPNVWTFPDAALRILKYSREGYDTESLTGMATDMVGCYSERIRLGDRTCAAELADAEEILRRLEKE